MKKISFLFLLANFTLCSLDMSASTISFNGQLWSTGYYINQNSSDSSSIGLGYIPKISSSYTIDDNSIIDFEYSHYIFKNYNTNTISNKYRFWARYSNDNLDARIGLQKISFGTAFFLRPLAWFDSLDFTSTTGQTDGVEALRFIYSPSNALAMWLWVIDNDVSGQSYGGRIEISAIGLLEGDWGFTYHKDTELSQYLSPYQFSYNGILDSDGGIIDLDEVSNKNNRLGIDYRYDGDFGFWIEGCHYIMKEKLTFLTLGFDYTMPAFNGILLKSETMFSRSSFIIPHYLDQSESFSVLSTNIYTAFHLDIPIDHINSLSLYSFSDREEYTSNNLIRWSTTYDSFNLDYMLTLKPGKFNDIFQIMFIYNH